MRKISITFLILSFCYNVFPQQKNIITIKNNSFDRCFVLESNKNIYAVKTNASTGRYMVYIYDSTHKHIGETKILNINNCRYINDSTVIHGINQQDDVFKIYIYNPLTDKNKLISLQTNVYSFHPVNEKTGYIIVKKYGFQHNTFLYKSNDYYQSFQQVNSWNDTDLDLYMFEFVNEDIGFCIGRKFYERGSKTETKYYYTNNSGQSFIEVDKIVDKPILINGDYLSVYFNKNNNQIVLLNYKTIFISNDLGNTFHPKLSENYKKYFNHILIGY